LASNRLTLDVLAKEGKPMKTINAKKEQAEQVF
jgi:hypothetical protein